MYARLTVRGTNAGRLFGLPATHQRYQVNMFDYVELADGKIIERVQQSDTLSQFRQLYARPLRRASTVLGGLLTASVVAVVATQRARRTRP